jgi:hypothetical protein
MPDGLHPSIVVYEKLIPCMLQTVVSSFVTTVKVNGRVSEVVGDVVRLNYKDPTGKIRLPNMKKPNHGLKKGDKVVVTVQNKPPYNILDFVKASK